MSEFQKITKQHTGTQKPGPTVTVWANGKLYFNEPAREHWLEDVDTVGFYAGEDGELGVSRNETGPDAYSVFSGPDHSGCEVTVRGPLQVLGVDVNAMDQSFEISAEERPTEGLIVLDLGPVIEAFAQRFECPESGCDESFDTERGVQVHVGRVHGGDES